MKLVTFATNRKEIDVGTTHPCSKHITVASTSRHQGTWGQHIAASRQTLPGIGVILLATSYDLAMFDGVMIETLARTGTGGM